MLIFILIVVIAFLIFYFGAPKEFSLEIPLKAYTPFRKYVQRLASKYNNIGFTPVFSFLTPLLVFEVTSLPPEIKDKGKSDELLLKITYNYFMILCNYAKSKGYSNDTQELIKCAMSYTYFFAAAVFKIDTDELIEKYMVPNLEGSVDAIVDIAHQYLNTNKLDYFNYSMDIEAEIRIWAISYLPVAYKAIDHYAGKSARYVRYLNR